MRRWTTENTCNRFTVYIIHVLRRWTTEKQAGKQTKTDRQTASTHTHTHTHTHTRSNRDDGEGEQEVWNLEKLLAAAGRAAAGIGVAGNPMASDVTPGEARKWEALGFPRSFCVA